MNSATARLLKAFSKACGLSYKAAKERWTLTPRNKRGELREEIERYLRS